MAHFSSKKEILAFRAKHQNRYFGQMVKIQSTLFIFSHLANLWPFCCFLQMQTRICQKIRALSSFEL